MIIDLPGNDLLRTLHRSPYGGYDSKKLKDMLRSRLREEFPNAIDIKVDVIETNIFFGIDVIGDDIDEVLDVQKRVSDVVKNVVEKAKIFSKK